MTALLASAVGNVIVKLPAVDVLSPPKSNTATAGSPDAESLKIIQPRAVIVAVPKVKSAKSVNAVVPELDGSIRVNEFPFAV
jgi:hypothetical protein